MNRNYNALILKSVKITAGAILAILFCLLSKLKVQRYSWHYHNFKHSKYKKGNHTDCTCKRRSLLLCTVSFLFML